MDIHFFARISVRCPRFVESAFSQSSESQGTNRLPPAMGFLSITTRTNSRYLGIALESREFFMAAIPRA